MLTGCPIDHRSNSTDEQMMVFPLLCHSNILFDLTYASALLTQVLGNWLGVIARSSPLNAL